MKKYKWEGIYTAHKSIYTKRKGYRKWNPWHSKLAALALKSPHWWLKKDTKILYLGAGNGTTASFISDIVSAGLIYCVDFSRRAFKDLLDVCSKRENLFPILADANHPERYLWIGAVDLVYQDIAQRNQAEIFIRNLRAFKATRGILMVKARSIDVCREPSAVFAQVKAQLSKEFEILEQVDLEPYQEDHQALLLENPEA